MTRAVNAPPSRNDSVSERPRHIATRGHDAVAARLLARLIAAPPHALLIVGPRGAGARPGPACYGLGGEEPTVTDANLVLGFLDASGLLGGQMPLRDDLARLDKRVERLSAASA